MAQLIDKDKIPNYALKLEIEKGNKKDKMKTRIAFWDDIEKLTIIESTTPDFDELLMLRKAYELVCDTLVNRATCEGGCLFANKCSDDIKCNDVDWVKEFFINKAKEGSSNETQN